MAIETFLTHSIHSIQIVPNSVASMKISFPETFFKGSFVF